MIVRGSTVLLTGGASGIGKELLKLLLAEDVAKVLVLDRDRKGLEEVKGAKTEIYPINLLDNNEIESFLDKAPDVDIVINCAGIGFGGCFEDHTQNDFENIMQVNYHAPVRIIRRFFTGMKKRGKGHIVNISSLAGLVPLPGESAYVGSKFAMRGFSEVLETEAAAYNVNVTTIYPGVVQTPIYKTGKIVGFDKEKILALWPKGITAQQCARKILSGIKKNKRNVPVTSFSVFSWLGYRLAPSIFKFFLRQYFKKIKKVAGLEGVTNV